MANNTLLASDYFASGSLAAGWSTLSFGLAALIGGSSGAYYAEPPNTTTAGAQMWGALSWPNDQISEVTIHAVPSSVSNVIVPFVRWQSTTVITGYALDISSSSYTLYKYINGASTTLISGSVTVSAGDVWSLVAAGSCLIVYQNQKMVNFVYDSAVSSGTPGFWISDTSPTTHAQISSWRGYSMQQQDGIWTKKQIVLPVTPSLDLPSGSVGELGPQNPSIIYEGNSQLGFSGNVYKMWFTSVGDGNTTGSIGYAESQDLYNWTRKATNVLSASGVGWTPFVIKSGGTYYLFDGGGTVQLYTSSDGISWALNNSSLFTKTNLVYFAPLIDIAGTWYAFYSDFSGYPPVTGYATASALTGPWTDGGNIASLNGLYGIQKIWQINGTYYAWGQSVNPNAQSTKPGIDPGEGLRMQSASITSGWTNPVNSIHHDSQVCGVNGVDSSCVPGALLDLNGKAAMIYQVNQDDAIATTKSIFQLAIATAPTSVENLVLYGEDAVQQTATDSFARSAGSLGANWTTPTSAGSLKIASSGIVEASATATNSIAFYNAASFGTAQYSEIVVPVLSASGNYVSPLVYAQSSGVNGYYALIQGPTGTKATVVIRKVVNGTATAIGPTVAFTPNTSNKYRLMVYQGSDGFNVLSFFQGGYLVAQVQDYSNAFTSGSPGIFISAGTLADAQISSWAGGNANVIPNYPSGSSWMQANRDFINKRGILGN
jgi:hypothetical protein